MRPITKQELAYLYRDGFSGASDNGFRLEEGDVAYCKESGIIVTCCNNCGDYSFIGTGELIL